MARVRGRPACVLAGLVLALGAIAATLALGAGAAIRLLAPIVLPGIERSRLTPEALEGLVTVGVLVLVGVLGGALTIRAGRLRARYEAILAIQRALAADIPLELALSRLRAILARHLRASEVGLVVRVGERLIVTGAARVASDSVVARVLATGAAAFVPDVGGGPRPRRVFVAPLVTGGATIGALALERVGEFGAEERAALEGLTEHIGLALETARLAARQRRVAEEFEENVASATRRLDELDRAKSSFVALASHELQTPLARLKEYSELLTMHRLPHDEVSRIAGIMRIGAKRLERIVSDLVDLARIERGLPLTLHRAPLAVEVVIATTADGFRCGSATHPVVVEYAAGLPRVDADPEAVARILTNLIATAMKYSPPGRVVRVRARGIADGAAVEVEVEDEGVGIPAEALRRVFEPFSRAPEAADTARDTGIGLAVVKSLVEAHGGRVRVESAPLAGTRVVFSLPAVP